jgi:hypothetical protein
MTLSSGQRGNGEWRGRWDSALISAVGIQGLLLWMDGPLKLHGRQLDHDRYRGVIDIPDAHEH